MSDLFAVISSVLIGIGSFFNPAGTTPSIPTDSTQPQETVCLNRELVRKGIDPGDTRVPKVLRGITKPSRENTTSGYEIEQCQGKGSCDGPETADYTLIAKNVRVDHTVFPNSFIEGVLTSDRQIIKQHNFTADPVLGDRYKNRIYRTHCGDWCYTCAPEDVKCLDPDCLKVECDTQKPAVELPYRGSFHCDFIFYLQDTDINGKPQIADDGIVPVSAQNASDPQTPKDGQLFSVYFRPDAPLPNYIQCNENNPENIEQTQITPFYSYNPYDTKTIGHPTSPNTRYIQLKNTNTGDGSFQARNSQILDSRRALGDITDPVGIPGTYTMYSNLLDPESDFFVYLVEPGVIDNAMLQLGTSSVNITSFQYLLFRRWDGMHPSPRSLKLATFPFSNDWIQRWVEESKPAIYLYPEDETTVNVRLNPKGYLTVSDPPYDKKTGWNVIASPDGTIRCNGTTQQCNNATYPYLYYEANLSEFPNPKKGHVVRRDNLTTFFRSSLALYGLNYREINDYIEYWMPRLYSESDKPYYLIYFLSREEIEYIEPISIDLTLDTDIRVRTYFKPLDRPIELTKQEIEQAVTRTGNVLVEWGGILDLEE